jgi:hypothetical protein
MTGWDAGSRCHECRAADMLPEKPVAKTSPPLPKEFTLMPTPTPLFKCSSCANPMEHWRNGSVCTSCRSGDLAKAAAKPGAAGAVKPQASGAKKPAGNVQEEFPKCPTCGTPTKDGTKCEDCRTSTDRDHKVGDLTVAQMEAQAKEAEAESEEETERRSIRRRARAAMARMLGLDDLAKAALDAEGNPPLVLKASTAKRFSFAPMYMPGRLDAHGEFVKSAEELQQAAWEYVRKTSGDRTVYLQHIDKPAGEWVEITSWPYPVDALMTVPGGAGKVRKATLPAGTVYMGVIWQPWAWNLVQKGRLLGFSMGGWAKRVQAELADETVTKNHTPHREPWEEAGLVNPNGPAARTLLPPKV